MNFDCLKAIIVSWFLMITSIRFRSASAIIKTLSNVVASCLVTIANNSLWILALLEVAALSKLFFEFPKPMVTTLFPLTTALQSKCDDASRQLKFPLVFNWSILALICVGDKGGLWDSSITIAVVTGESSFEKEFKTKNDKSNNFTIFLDILIGFKMVRFDQFNKKNFNKIKPPPKI